MKNLHLAVIAIAFVWTNVADCKSQQNHLLKKATTQLKPTKGPKNLLETFKNLPADDFEFIKQLDKQFNKFGDNIKIKIQKENRTTTTTTKNIKRTIDGSLGYGYQNPNDQQSTYTFSKPKYEIYPYSQHDIPPSSEYHQRQHQLHYLRNYPTALIESDPDYFRKQVTNGHGHGHTSVEIQPSHSYEIKQTEHGSYKTIYHGSDGHLQDYAAQTHEDEAHSGEAVPVIVLRVPGPAKYASHLQTLLQQYIEQRAAQYLQTLQEQEAHGIDSSQQYQDDEQNLNAYSGLPVLPYGQTQAYVPAQMYIQPLQAIPYYSQSLNPYANAHIAQPIDIGEHVVDTDAPAAYYTPSAHSDEASDQHTGVVQPTAYEYHNIHDEQQHHQHQHQHDTQSNEEQIVYGQPQETVSQHDELLTNENYPDDKHTQVYFKSTTETPYQSQEQYGHEQPLSHQYVSHAHVNTYRAPLVYHKLEQFYNPHDGYAHGHSDDNQEQYASNEGYDDNAQQIVSSTPYAGTVTITQRPAVLPHNYHAQVPQLAHYDDNQGYEYSTQSEENHLYRRNSSRKRQSNQNREDQMKKFKRLANRMKSRMTAARQTNPEQVQA